MSLDIKEIHDKLHDAITEYDRLLDSRQDPTTAGKTKIINDRIAATSESSAKIVENLTNQLKDQPVDVQIGIYFGIVRGLDSTFKAPVDAAIANLILSQPKVEPLITEDEEKDILKRRNEMAAKVKQLLEMASFVDEETASQMHEAPKRSNRQGKRGKRALSLYKFYVGDKEFTSLKEVVEAYSSSYEKVADLTRSMRGDTSEMKDGKEVWTRGQLSTDNPTYIDTTNPPATFTFTLANGDVLEAVGPSTEEDDDDDESSESTPDGD